LCKKWLHGIAEQAKIFGKLVHRKRYIPMSDDSSSLHTRPSLLVRIRDAHDAESWELFVELYTPLVLRYCRLRGLQDADAADVTQEVMAQVARSMHSFQYSPERGRFRDWLGTVTRRKVNRFLEALYAAGSGIGGDDAADALANVAAVESDAEWTAEFNAEILRVALERVRPQFGPTTWQAFTSVWLENKTAAATASAMDTTLQAVYVAKAKVLKRLEEEVIELAEDVPLAAPAP
jgi:RNA polymerase sigma factor (sigma-70 family)